LVVVSNPGYPYIFGGGIQPGYPASQVRVSSRVPDKLKKGRLSVESLVDGAIFKMARHCA
jgi:hypothetical protein